MSGWLPRPEPREQFRRELRARLLAEVRVIGEARSRRGTVWTGWLRPARLRPVLVALTLAAILAGTAGTAAAGSLPGEAAYGLKRAVEQLQVVLAADDEAKVSLLAEQADRRLAEFERAASEGEGSPTATDEYTAAVERLREAVERLVAADPDERGEAVIEVVEAARQKHLEVLESLKGRLSEEARRAVERAIDQAERIRGRPAGVPGGTGDGDETPEPSETGKPGGPPAHPTPPSRGDPATGTAGPPPGVPADPIVPPPARPVEPEDDR